VFALNGHHHYYCIFNFRNHLLVEKESQIV
jgi:hypothetical protein